MSFLPLSATDGTRLLLWRKQHGLRQEDLAKMLYVSRQTVHNWENNKTRLPKLFWERAELAKAEFAAAKAEASKARQTALAQWRESYRSLYAITGDHAGVIEQWGKMKTHDMPVLSWLALSENTDILAALAAERVNLENSNKGN